MNLGDVINDSSGTVEYFSIRYFGGQYPGWYVGYGDPTKPNGFHTIGYFDETLWKNDTPSTIFEKGDSVQWYGEVATVNQPSGDCTQMGNGHYAQAPGAAVIGAMGYWTPDFHWQNTATEVVDDATLYNMNDQGLSASWFGYGGPGCPLLA